MTQDEIIEMARHIADTFGTRMCDENNDTHGEELYAMGMDDIVETIKLVAAKATASEREACAKLLESRKTGANELMDAVRDMEAKAIRARGEQA
jgi:hypothetical protein